VPILPAARRARREEPCQVLNENSGGAAGFARRGSTTYDLENEPVEVVMAREARRTSIGSGAYRDRTGDLRLANTVIALENLLLIGRS